MDKIETRTQTIEQRRHYFYCDHCDTYLGMSEEYEDGWYYKFGEFAMNWNTQSGWYSVEKCLCNKCKEKYLSEVYTALEQLGFKKEN